MFIDARSVDDAAVMGCDVCIVGAGAAGITLATELSRADLDVCVLESGGLTPEADTQRLYEGESVGGRYKISGEPAGPVSASRLRFFGGSTNHWVGFCRPLDAFDFEPRPYARSEGWPIRRASLGAYYARAQRICDLGPNTYEPEFWARRAGGRPLREDRNVTNAVFQMSPPTRFGPTYRRALERARRVRVLLNANAVALAAPEGRAVRRLEAATLNGRRFAIRARTYVLAAGAIENARLLLASQAGRRTGVGNEHDLVGRFFTDHPQGRAATLAVPMSSRALDFYRPDAGMRRRAVGTLTTTDTAVRSERLLRFSAIVLDSPADPPPLAEGVPKLMQLMGERGKVRFLGLHMSSEVAPNRDSRVTLGDDTDALGVPRVRVDWQLGELERRSVERSLELIGRHLGALGVARLLSHPRQNDRFWEDEVTGGSHHLGTTRMHRDPRRGVVDADCRVHGMANLYVAGSSVFPTTGYANPTLTIVALALRLADRLRGRG